MWLKHNNSRTDRSQVIKLFLRMDFFGECMDTLCFAQQYSIRMLKNRGTKKLTDSLFHRNGEIKVI